MTVMAYVNNETSELVRMLGEIEDGSAREVELARTAPAGCSLVALDCDASAGDRVRVTESGVATRVIG